MEGNYTDFFSFLNYFLQNKCKLLKLTSFSETICIPNDNDQLPFLLLKTRIPNDNAVSVVFSRISQTKKINRITKKMGKNFAQLFNTYIQVTQ